MKYFGKKSLSSVMSVILHIAWYVVLLTAVIAPLAMTGVIVFSTPLGEQIVSQANCGTNISSADINNSMNSKNARDWETFKNLPLAVKILMLPYLEGILVLLLLAIRKSRLLFTNFKNDIVFNKSNVGIISTVSKLLIGFSILTFSLSTLLISIVLLLLCEIIKNGTALQEEHDLTV